MDYYFLKITSPLHTVTIYYCHWNSNPGGTQLSQELNEAFQKGSKLDLLTLNVGRYSDYELTDKGNKPIFH